MYIASGDNNAGVNDQVLHWVIFICVLFPLSSLLYYCDGI